MCVCVCVYSKSCLMYLQTGMAAAAMAGKKGESGDGLGTREARARRSGAEEEQTQSLKGEQTSDCVRRCGGGGGGVRPF